MEKQTLMLNSVWSTLHHTQKVMDKGCPRIFLYKYITAYAYTTNCIEIFLDTLYLSDVSHTWSDKILRYNDALRVSEV